MIRLFIYFFSVGLLAGLAAWFANNPGDVVIHWMGYEAQTSVGVLICGAAFLAVLAYFVIGTARLVWNSPAAFQRMRKARRRARRLGYLMRGFSAVAIGDAEGARKALRAAEGGDDLAGLKPLLIAQTAELVHDDKSAEAAYRDLIKRPDTEFLGLRGLYETAMRQGDRAAALAFVTRAFDARPRSPWLGEQLFRVQTQSSAWDLARKTITSMKRTGGLSSQAARRREGVIMAAEALAVDAAGDRELAITFAHKALSLAPGITPLVVMIARAQAAEGQVWRAAGMIESAWRVNPHPDLAAVYRTLKTGETDQQRARRMMGLAEFNPNHVESRLLVAQEALSIGEFRRARRALLPALDAGSARVLMLMAEIALRAGGGEAEAQAFRARAVGAPRDGRWVCSSCTHERDDWVAVCDKCGAFDTFQWGAQGSVAGSGLTVA
ncbi:MAG: heme biosynthesis HemY N-terminal domain-containing protein, partial [Alphaproteobacteria bacterium]